MDERNENENRGNEGDEGVFTGIAYDDVPEKTDRITDLTVADIQGNIDGGVFSDLPVYHEHANMDTKDPIGKVLGATMVRMPRGNGGHKNVLMLTYKLDTKRPGAGQFIQSVRNGVLPCLSLSHHAVSKRISEVSVVHVGMREGANRLADGRDLVRHLREKDSRLADAAEKNRVIRTGRIGLATTRAPMAISASKGSMDSKQMEKELESELEFVAAMNTDTKSTPDPESTPVSNAALAPIPNKLSNTGAVAGLLAVSSSSSSPPPLPLSSAPEPGPRPSVSPTMSAAISNAPPPLPHLAGPSSSSSSSSTPQASEAPAETGQSTQSQSAANPVEGLFTRLAEKAGSDPDAAVLLKMIQTQTEQINSQTKEFEKKDAVYRHAVQQSRDALMTKLGRSQLDAKTRGLIGKWIDAGGAEQYLLDGTNPLESSSDAQDEKIPSAPRNEPAVSMSLEQPALGNPPLSIRTEQLLNNGQVQGGRAEQLANSQHPIQHPAESVGRVAPKQQATLDIDPKKLAREYQHASFVNTRTGVVTFPVERKVPQDNTRTPSRMSDDQESAPLTVREAINQRLANNSFAKRYFDANPIHVYQTDNQVIQASAFGGWGTTADEMRLYAQATHDTIAFGRQHIIDGLTQAQNAARIGSKRKF